MAKKKVKYLVIQLEERNGEREYTHRCLHTTKCDSIDFAAEWYCAHFWGESTGLEDEWWWFHDVMVRVYSVKEVSKKQFNLLNRLIY